VPLCPPQILHDLTWDRTWAVVLGSLRPMARLNQGSGNMQVFHATSTNFAKCKVIPVMGCGGPKGCETLRLPHFLDNRLTDGGEVVSLHASRPLPPGRFLVLISVRGWVDPRATVQLEGLGQLKNPMTSSGIKPVTLQLAA
jgi:hypothetical protein